MSGDVPLPPAFLDTNVLVYLFDISDPVKRAKARAVVAGHQCFVSPQVLGEFYVVVTRKLATPLSPADAAAAVAGWPPTQVVPLTAALVTAAIATSQAHRLHYWDALVVEAAAEAGCPVLLTEDLADGSTLRGVRIANPFV
ncbi:MAG: PIN domain-containing protein [Propionibacteriaceae bacterium]|jgi:predicted nucleic acid-binding protein|nr:PIN domain-containing protein [Propionibacteriaceae bacterium]